MAGFSILLMLMRSPKNIHTLDHHLANFKASRVFLKTLDRLEKGKESFAFETTLSGKAYLKKIERLIVPQ